MKNVPVLSLYFHSKCALIQCRLKGYKLLDDFVLSLLLDLDAIFKTPDGMLRKNNRLFYVIKLVKNLKTKVSNSPGSNKVL